MSPAKRLIVTGRGYLPSWVPEYVQDIAVHVGEEFSRALETVSVAPLTMAGVYPRGPLLRVAVRPPAGSLAGWTHPGVLDPIGVIWLARTGEFATLHGSVGRAKEIAGPEAYSLIMACDGPHVGMTAAEKYWRLVLEHQLGMRFPEDYPTVAHP